MRTLRSLRMRQWLAGAVSAVMALALGCSVLVLSSAQPAQAAAGRPVTALFAVVIVLIVTVGCACALAWWIGYEQGFLAAIAYRKADDERRPPRSPWSTTSRPPSRDRHRDRHRRPRPAPSPAGPALLARPRSGRGH
jgi:hypothetical protein